MSEKQIKNSINNIEPEAGAKERMYRNIMKKAHQAAPPEKSAELQRKKHSFARYALPVAACFCLLIIGIIRFFPNNTPFDPGENNVQGSNPFAEVENAEAFNALSITLDAPAGAQKVSYAIIDGTIAEIQFELDGKSYLARASAQEGDFSGLNGRELSRETVDAKNNAVLTEVQTDLCTYYKIIWTNGKIKYCLSGADGATREQVMSVYDALKKITAKMSEDFFKILPTFFFPRSLYICRSAKMAALCTSIADASQIITFKGAKLQ